MPVNTTQKPKEGGYIGIFKKFYENMAKEFSENELNKLKEAKAESDKPVAKGEKVGVYTYWEDFASISKKKVKKLGINLKNSPFKDWWSKTASLLDNLFKLDVDGDPEKSDSALSDALKEVAFIGRNGNFDVKVFKECLNDGSFEKNIWVNDTGAVNQFKCITERDDAKKALENWVKFFMKGDKQ